jgi:iron complex outermembrane receptor protein
MPGRVDMQMRKVSWSCSGFVIVSALLAQQAVAQDPAGQAAPEDTTTGIQEIIVTAQKRSESINDVPVSVTALSGEQLAEQRILDPEDLANVVPGLHVSNTGSTTPFYSIRGIGFADQNIASNATVAVYQDEVPLPYPIMTTGASLDLERVEVLKGPQGTLFGQNSTGGAINYIAAKPTRSFEAGAEVSYGRFNRLDVNGFVSGPLGDKAGIRLALTNSHADGWQRSLTRPGDTLGGVNRGGGRLTLEIEPIPALRISAVTNGWYDKSDTRALQAIEIRPSAPANLPAATAASPLAGDNFRDADWDPGTRFRMDDWMLQQSLRADWELSDAITITSITSYAEFSSRQVVDKDGIAVQSFKLDPAIGKIRTFSQELRVGGSAGPVDWIVGGNLSRDKTRNRYDLYQLTASNTVSVFGLPFSNAFIISNQDIATNAVFANLDWHLTDKLTLSGGVRYSKEDRDFEGCTGDLGNGISARVVNLIIAAQKTRLNLPPGPAAMAGQCWSLDANANPGIINTNLTEDNVSWRAVASYEPSSDALFYGSVSRGYKSGAFPMAGVIYAIQTAPATQENVTAYEAGAKLTLLDRILQLNVAGFYYDYRDKQLFGRQIDPIFGPLTRLVNIPTSEVKGAEIEATFMPADDLTLTASATYVDTKIKEYTGPDSLGRVFNFNGYSFNYAPKLSFNAGAEYSFPIADDKKISLGANLAHRSKTHADFGTNPTERIDAYTTVDARVGLESDRGWRVSLWAKNLFNEYYWTNVVKSHDTFSRVPGVVPSYGITLGFRTR